MVLIIYCLFQLISSIFVHSAGVVAGGGVGWGRWVVARNLADTPREVFSGGPPRVRSGLVLRHFRRVLDGDSTASSKTARADAIFSTAAFRGSHTGHA